MLRQSCSSSCRTWSSATFSWTGFLGPMYLDSVLVVVIVVVVVAVRMVWQFLELVSLVLWCEGGFRPWVPASHVLRGGHWSLCSVHTTNIVIIIKSSSSLSSPSLSPSSLSSSSLSSSSFSSSSKSSSSKSSWVDRQLVRMGYRFLVRGCKGL